MNEEKPDDILQKMPDGLDLLHVQKIGKVILSQYDPFLDGLGSIWEYPEDAP